VIARLKSTLTRTSRALGTALPRAPLVWFGRRPQAEREASAERRGNRWFLPLSAIAGIALFAWTIWSVGPQELAAQLRALAPVLLLILVLAAARFLFQAAGWRLAMAPARRPPWHDAFAAVVAGEAAGYFAWGTMSREPMKALLLEHRMPHRDALAAAIVERFAYSAAAAVLIVAGIAIAAVRFHFVGWLIAGLTITAAMLFALNRLWRRRAGAMRRDTATWIAIAACAAAQEISNVVEAYLVLAWLGAAPAVAPVIVLEGVSRLMNGAGQFIPGKLGITEAATTALAEGLQLGGAHGLSLALARRARSLAWGALGIAFITFRAGRY
jgi:Lysylphosphatidylglycerol synthase TM region